MLSLIKIYRMSLISTGSISLDSTFNTIFAEIAPLVTPLQPTRAGFYLPQREREEREI
jgi:hypothetical protein